MLLYFLLPALTACVTLRVMTFNIWLSGAEVCLFISLQRFQVNNGLAKIAKHILLVNPDVVALEVWGTREVL